MTEPPLHFSTVSGTSPEAPPEILRSLNALAGQFEVVDDQFENLRKEREAYRASVRNSPDLSAVALNLDSFTEYLAHWFPGRQLEGYNGQLGLVFDKLLAAKITNVGEVNRAIRDSKSARHAMFGNLGLSDIRRTTDKRVPASLEALFAVALATATDLSIFRFNSRWKPAVEQYRQWSERLTSACSRRRPARS